MATIFITGCSSGFGLETARYFLDRGWDVIATMRTPREDLLPASPNLRILALDVTRADSIAAAVAAAGPIDALVNNAGIGFLNAVEGSRMEIVRDLFETNTLGTIAMTQAVLPQMRERRSGVIVNVTSGVTLRSLPLLSVYTATKAAVNAFSDSMALELEQFGIRVHVVLPGRAPDTRFSEHAQGRMGGGFPQPYADMVQKIFAGWQQETGPLTAASDVAEAVWRSVTDASAPAHIPAGADVVARVQAR
jgi:NAD(P)-dependent dehydrogenase (short-subunit alcohol dehydrogenase family)